MPSHLNLQRSIFILSLGLCTEMNNEIKYTVVIPSRNRQTYCISAIKSIILAKRQDIEVIVLDNSDNTKLLPKLIKKNSLDKKVTLIQSENKCLSMADNWERALDFISGKWVMFIGDDDGCTQCTFDAFDHLTSNFNFFAFRWPVFYYKWPCFPGFEKGRLKLPLSVGTLEYYNSSKVLQRSSSWEGAKRWPSIGPSVYHGLVNAEIVKEGRDKHGRYFIGHTVDYASGIINAMLLDGYMKYSFPLTIIGASGYSNTAALTCSQLKSKGNSQVEECKNLMPVFDNTLKNTQLSTPYVAYDFKVLFDKLGLDFKLTSEQFFESCITDLRGVRSQTIFETEKARLIAYAKKIGLGHERLRSKTYHRYYTPLGPQEKNSVRYLTVDASSLGYDGIDCIYHILPKIYTEYSWVKQNELAVLKNAVPSKKLSA